MSRQTLVCRLPTLTLMVLVFVVAVLLSAMAVPVHAKTKRVAPVDGEVGAVIPQQRLVSLTFKQLGAWSPVNLRGSDGSRILNFSIRSDEVVVAAKLRIAYNYSPSLIPELSHLRVFLNDRVAAVEALPLAQGVDNTRDINIDPRWFGETNNLRFNLIAHYTRQCEDPFHSSLWLTISDLSRLELTLAPAGSVYDLKNLPAPFFDKRDINALSLPFVFSANPSVATLKSAGVVASWFGLQSGSKGAQFPVSLNALPDGNAVVFLQGSERIAGVPDGAGSSISIQAHPTNPLAKLLLVTGRSDEDLARAARAMVLISRTLSGQAVTVTQDTPAAPRKPYDAPAWLPTDRPVRFGELARLDELRVQGYYPEVIRLNYRLSPDIFTWRSGGAPLNLKYRDSRLPLHQNSSLNVNLNSSFIHTFALNGPEPASPTTAGTVSENIARKERTLLIPPYAANGRDQLQFGFSFDVIRQGLCNDMPPDNLQAAIDPESTLDYSRFPHFVALPNLAYFANIGFPFTRMADLSETAVVLPDSPVADELSAYLMLMGRMGEATAYPSLGHVVAYASNVEAVKDRDLLVIGTARGPALMTKWADALPMVRGPDGRRVREPVARWFPSYRWQQEDVQATPASKARFTLTGAGSLTSLMAFESPLQANRSVVFLYADKAKDLGKISDVLTDAERVGSVQGDFAVIDDKSVSHARVSASYYLGSLPWLSKGRWFFADNPLLLGFIALLLCLLAAAVAYAPARRFFAKRKNKVA